MNISNLWPQTLLSNSQKIATDAEIQTTRELTATRLAPSLSLKRSTHLRPEVLIRAGILGNLENPGEAYRRAKSLLNQGKYQAATEIIFPHFQEQQTLANLSPEADITLAETPQLLPDTPLLSFNSPSEPPILPLSSLDNHHNHLPDNTTVSSLSPLFAPKEDYAVPNPSYADLAELLAHCQSLRYPLNSWFKYALSALKIYTAQQDLQSLARMQRFLGEMLIFAGELTLAQERLTNALEIYQRFNDNALDIALTTALLAKIPFRMGLVNEAGQALTKALKLLVLHDLPRREGLTRLDLALIYAHQDNHTAAAHELVRAEHLLVQAGNPTDHLRARLMMAEMLLVNKQPKKALQGLEKLTHLLPETEEVKIHGRFWFLLGEALKDEEPLKARAYFKHSRELFYYLNYTYDVLRAELALLDLETADFEPHELTRLELLLNEHAHEWPVLHMEFTLLKTAKNCQRGLKPRTYQELFTLRDRALEQGNRLLLLRIIDLLSNITANHHLPPSMQPAKN